MSRYRIEFDRAGCIGAAACNEQCPGNWEMKADGKSDSKVKEIDESQLECNMDAAKACPVKVIHIINIDTGEKLI